MSLRASYTVPATLVLAGVMLISLGFLIGFAATGRGDSAIHAERTAQLRLTDFDLTNPLLECEGADATIGDRTFRPFKNELNSLVSSILNRGQVRQLAVYFRDLNNGPWYGINENLEFYPASLMKIPVAMVFTKEAEADPRVLQRVIKNTLSKDYNTSRVYPSSRAVLPGRSYRVRDLIEIMLSESDNNAVVLLGRHMNRAIAEQLFADLGLPAPTNEPRDYLSIRSFSMLFRTLFNASYVSKDASEELLSLLSRSSFRQGIAAGVPEGVMIANKYGEQQLGPAGSVKELHDCGIIYYPDSPYLLCVMSKGDSYEADEAAIREISRFVFSVVDSEQREHSDAKHR
ncbi:MAG: serine hydrolase [Nitrospirota bacterium]|nr:serine hydrolase [Nitrospirota bacterium]